MELEAHRLLHYDLQQWTHQRKRAQERDERREGEWEHRKRRPRGSALNTSEEQRSSSLTPSLSSSIVQMSPSSLLQSPFSLSSHSHLTSLWSTGAWSAEEYSGREMSAELRPAWKHGCVQKVHTSYVKGTIWFQIQSATLFSALSAFCRHIFNS